MKKLSVKITREILENLPFVEKAFAKYLIQKGEIKFVSDTDLKNSGGDFRD